MTVVARDPDGNEVLREDIPLIVNTVARPTAAVALVLDESGSMLADAGNNRIRINVLRDAAKSLVDELYDDNGLTLIPFADNAANLDRKSGVRGKRVSVRVALGGARFITKKKQIHQNR